MVGDTRDPVQVPLAEVWLHLRDYSFRRIVVVVDTWNDQALLGQDLGLLPYLTDLSTHQKASKERMKQVLVTTELSTTKNKSSKDKTTRIVRILELPQSH